MQVKCFEDINLKDLENSINDFIVNKDIISIDYETYVNDIGLTYYSALMLYEGKYEEAK